MNSKWNLLLSWNLKINAGKFPSKKRKGYNTLSIKHKEDRNSQERRRDVLLSSIARTSIFTDELPILKYWNKTGTQVTTDGNRAEVLGKCYFNKIMLQIAEVQQVPDHILRQIMRKKSKHERRGFGINYHRLSLSSDYNLKTIVGIKFQMLCTVGSKI